MPVNSKPVVKYKFREPKDGYLIYRKQLNPNTRKALTYVLRLLNWLIKRRDQNREVNKIILKNLDLPEDTVVSDLDAYYKKEFRRQKAAYGSKQGASKDVTPPTPFYYHFFTDVIRRKTKDASWEFLKSFISDNAENKGEQQK